MPETSNQPADQADDRVRLSGDRPKEHLADDRLGYANFAQSLARSIADLAPTEGIVLAVNGPWGSGKTTVVNMIVEALAGLEETAPATDEILAIRFNPWWFSEQEDLIRAFFAELSASFDKKLSDKVEEGFRKIARRIASSREIVVAGLGLVPGAAIVKEMAGAAMSTVGGLAGGDKSLSRLREDLSAALCEQHKRLLVIIDDIDRLPANEVRQIFRLVKSVADLPNVIYLLIFDRKVAEQAFDDPGDAPKWHEKIVQAAFDLPPIQPIDIQHLFLEGLTKLAAGKEASDPVRRCNVFHDCIAPWLRTPRDAGRLLNSLVVSWPAVAREVDFADLIALETIRLFEPALHSFIRHNPHHLTGLAYAMDCDIGAKENLGEEVLATVEHARHERVKAALKRLFPKLENVWGNQSYEPGFLGRWDRERRVCVERRFPAYFRFGMGSDAVSRDELENFTANVADSDYVWPKVAEYADTVRRPGGTKAAVLLEELSANIDLISAGSLPRAVVNLLDAADLFMNARDERGTGILSIPAIWRLWFVIKPLLERLDPTARSDALRTAFATARSLQGLRFALTVFRTSLGRDPDARRDDAGPSLVDPQVCDQLEEALLARFRAAAANGQLLTQGGLIENLLQWVRLAGEAEVRAWTNGLLGDDASALTLARAATQTTRAHAEGDRVARLMPAVYRPGLERVVDIEGLIARLEEIKQSESGTEALAIIRDFNLGLKGQRPLAPGTNNGCA